MILSHPAENKHAGKPLTVHLTNVAEEACARIQRLSLNTRFLKKEQISDLAFRAGLFHDIGKGSSYFQKYLVRKKPDAFTKHSLISATYLFFDLLNSGCKIDVAALCFKAVQRHHSHLQSFGQENINSSIISSTLKIHADIMQQIADNKNFADFILQHNIHLQDLDKRSFDSLRDALVFLEEADDTDAAIERFFIQNLLFSVLIDADKYDAARIQFTVDSALALPICYAPDNYINGLEKPDSELNSFRNKLREAAQNQALGDGLYAMSAPTGSGKTLACLAFADSMQKSLDKPRRLIYCLPYTSIIDQNYQEFEKVLQANHIDLSKPDLLLKHHHLVDYSRAEKNDDYDYQDFMNDNLLADSWNSACIVSTFVQLFHSLIGTRNGMVRKLHNILNSVILLDEVQSMPPKYYPLLRQVFKILAERFDTHILSCTATQPFIFQPNSYHEITPPGLFEHPIFNRVQLRIDLNPQSLEDFAENLDLGQAPNALLVMNTKRSAIELYHILKERFEYDYKLYCLTTLHTPFCRKKILKQVDEALAAKDKLILISTQLIEAGVDLSFSRVYRDFGPLDSIVQVAGRCNRHTELGPLGGSMHIIYLKGDHGEYAHQVYDKHILRKTHELLSNHETIESQDFADLIKEYYQSLDFKAESEALLKAIQRLNYDADIPGELAIDRFRLIEEKYATKTVYLLLTKSSARTMENLMEAQNKLKDFQNLKDKELSVLRLKIAKAYRDLALYQVNLSYHELRNYSEQMSFFHKLSDDVYYIEHQSIRNAYCPQIGFLTEPNAQGSALAL